MQEDELEQTLVELTDETGRMLRFRFVAALTHRENDYVVLADLEPERDDEDELLILRVRRELSGQEQYVVLDDAEEVQAVFEQYVTSALSDVLDGFEDEDSEDDGPLGGVLH